MTALSRMTLYQYIKDRYGITAKEKHMNREELLNKVRKCTPYYTFDTDYPNLFGKYGTMVYGICDYWYWYEEDKLTERALKKGFKPLTDATDSELLEMLAITNGYWLSCYKKWLEKSEKKSHKLDSFIGKCERDYFGYDSNGYTDETIDRIFNSIYEILDEHFEKRREHYDKK